MLSDDFKQYSDWRGVGLISVEDFEKIKSPIVKAHKQGIRVRLWNAPDVSNAWTRLVNLQVDYINTDHIAGLAEWLQSVHFEYISPVR